MRYPRSIADLISLLGLVVGSGIPGGLLAAPPNILLLVAEDLSPRIGAYGDPVAQTPHLDALARRGMRFTQAFTTAGVCAPSRAALITGLHQSSFGAQHMRAATGPLGEYYARPPEGHRAFPERLRAAGYYTFTDGKLDYQFSGIRAGTGPFTIWDAEGAEASWRGRPAGAPFFGLINFMETHESGVMRPDGPPVSPGHAQTQAFRRQLGLVAPSLTDPADVLLPPYYPDLPAVRSDLARHYDNIRAMDARVGRILKALADEGLADETIVIWTSDHGDGLPRAKRELFDSGIRVPLVVYLPPAWAPEDWSPGGTDSRLVSFVDLGPTILGLAGVPVVDDVHGRDVLAGTPRTHIFAARDRIDEVSDRQRAVRDGRYKLIRSWHPEVPGGHPLAYRDNLDMVGAWRAAWQAGKLTADQAQWFEPVGEERLYDTEQDPFELENRIDAPALADVRRRLRDALMDWMARIGDLGWMPEAALRASLTDNGQVPITEPPRIRLDNGRLHAEVDGDASIGFSEGEGSWQLYTGPVRVTLPVRVKAVRYGFRESPVVSISPTSGTGSGTQAR